MKIRDIFYKENYYINNPIKFYIQPKKVRDILMAILESIKIGLAKTGSLKWAFNERIVERPFVFMNLPKKEGAKVLDIGCSDSIMPLEIAALGYESYGNDPKKYPYKYPGFKFLKGDALNLEIPNNSLDAVTCISVIEHVGLSGDYGEKRTENRKDKILMDKIKSMLKKKGVLILTTMAGKKRILPSKDTRIYDLEELNWLTENFNKIKEEFYYQKNEFWIKAKPNEIKRLIEKNFELVVLFLLEKE